MDLFFNNPGFFHIGQKIIAAVDTKTQLQCRLVCKTWKDILEDPILNYEDLKSWLTWYLDIYFNRIIRKSIHERSFSLGHWEIYQERFEIWTKWHDFISTLKRTGRKSTLVFLLRQPTFLNSINPNTPLELCLKIGDVEIGKFLLHNRLATIEMVQSKLWCSNFKTVKTTCSKIIDWYNDSVVRASESGDLDTLKILVPNPEVFLEKSIYADRFGNNPIHIAAKLGYIDIVKYFISYEGNRCTQNTNCKTPLYLAVRHNRIEIVDIICEALSTHLILSEECNVKNEIHLANEMGHFEIVKLLIMKGTVDPAFKDLLVNSQNKEKVFECNKCFEYKDSHKAIFIQHYKKCLRLFTFKKRKLSE